jgi:hypothetical protein
MITMFHAGRSFLISGGGGNGRISAFWLIRRPPVNFNAPLGATARKDADGSMMRAEGSMRLEIAGQARNDASSDAGGTPALQMPVQEKQSQSRQGKGFPSLLLTRR